jgi:hypothetical protein
MKLNYKKPTKVVEAQVDMESVINDVARFLKIYKGLGFSEYTDEDFVALRTSMKLTEEDVHHLKND